MIIALAGSEKEPILLLGLSRANLERLQAGDPIVLTRKTHGEGIPEGWTISIMFGETEREMVKALSRAALIGPDTEFKIDPRL